MLKIKNILLAHDLTSSTDGAVALATWLARETGALPHVVFADILCGAGSVTDKFVRGAPCPVFTVRSYGKMLVAQHALEKAEHSAG